MELYYVARLFTVLIALAGAGSHITYFFQHRCNGGQVCWFRLSCGVGCVISALVCGMVFYQDPSAAWEPDNRAFVLLVQTINLSLTGILMGEGERKTT